MAIIETQFGRTHEVAVGGMPVFGGVAERADQIARDSGAEVPTIEISTDESLGRLVIDENIKVQLLTNPDN